MENEKGLTPQEMGLSDEEQRVQNTREHNPDAAYAEAHLVNARYGDRIKDIGSAKEISDIVGDTEGSKSYELEQNKLMNETAEKETLKVNDILVQAARKGLGQNVQYPNPMEGTPLHQILNREEVILDPSSVYQNNSFGIEDMEHLAKKINSKLETITETGKNGDIVNYDVVKLSDTADYSTYITNGTGVSVDRHPRVFKLAKKSLENNDGYSINDHDYKSIFPDVKEKPPEEEMSANA